MQRLALHIEYHGEKYYGWQKQSHRPSVQAHVEAALAKVANHPVLVYCAGRTDSGVHATSQIIHFDTNANRQQIAWVRGVNSYLPQDIRVLGCYPVSADFDARKSAIYRRYCYIIANRPISPGIMHHAMSWVIAPLDAKKMHIAASYLLGKHDFTSFRATQCQAKTPIRTLHSIQVERVGDLIILDVTANAFLHHMVRNIVGTLIQVGQNKQPVAWIKEVLAAKDRRYAGLTASPAGLYLIHVGYPSEFNLPAQPQFPWFYTLQRNAPIDLT